MKILWIALTVLVSLSCAIGAATLSSLTSGMAVSGTDLFYDVQTVGKGGVSVTASQLKNFMSSSPVVSGTATFTGTIVFPDTSTWSATGLTATTATITGLTATTLSFSGQLVSAGGKPSVFACGTSPTGAVSATSTNQAGSLQTGGTSLTSCSIGFSAVLSATPKVCTIVPQSSGAASDMTQTFVSALTAGGWTLSAVNTVNSVTFGYMCL